MKKHCVICGNEFEVEGKAKTRQYCFECSPSFIKNDNRSRAYSISCLRKAMKKKAVELHGGKCERCGYDEYIGALQFHHTDPAQKKFGLSSDGKLHTWQEYYQESLKCKLLCANCHALIHDIGA